MSGGHFDYKQYAIESIIDELAEIIDNPDEKEWYNFPDDIRAELQKGLQYLRIAAIYTHRIDWLVSGDDRNSCFRERLREDLVKAGFLG